MTKQSENWITVTDASELKEGMWVRVWYSPQGGLMYGYSSWGEAIVLKAFPTTGLISWQQALVNNGIQRKGKPS